MRMMQDSNGFKEEALFLSADELQLVKWYVDASFAVHGDFRSHTDDAMTYGTDVPISISRKQNGILPVGQAPRPNLWQWIMFRI
jgi:hypothetical protein